MNDRLKFRVWNQLWDCYSMDDFYIDEDGDLNILGSEYVVEQCTGLKDKNGNLIYEGDIIKAKDYEDKRIVCWSQESCSYRLKNGYYDCGGLYPVVIEELEYEIIGNIHENKELLDER